MKYEDIPIEEYDDRNRSLHAKVENKEPLNIEEQAFFCHCLKLNHLLFHPFCLDEYFSRSFLGRTPDTPKGMFPFTDRDPIYYEGLVKEWENVINTTNHPDELLQITCKDARDELRNLKKGYSFLLRHSSSEDYLDRKFKLLEWSKYRFIMIKRIFELEIKSNEYILSLNKESVIFDYYSVSHILTRHYGHIMKMYDTDKSHFTKDIHHEEIHTKLEQIFAKIDTSGLYQGQSLKDISIRYCGTLYKIYIVPAVKGAKKTNRVSTFFPIEDDRLLIRLERDYSEKVIDESLSIFTRNDS
jgi:hypothetical protein